MLYCTESGPINAPTIVFLHGGGVSGWSWKPEISRLPDYHCIVPDLPGHGKSPTKDPIKIATAAEEVAELIKSKAPSGRTHVVGLSLGGQVALQLLSTYPELVDRVVVSCTNTSPSNSIRILSPLLKLIMVLYGPLQNTGYLIHANMKQNCVPPEYEAEFREDTRLITPDIFTQMIVESMTFPLPLLEVISGLLVVCGEKEPELVRKSARMIRSEYSSVPCFVVLGVGHNWGMEKPGLFADMIRSWVERFPLPEELIRLS
jgi:pimeloyl-ACP methyl ester carboxylesterase